MRNTWGMMLVASVAFLTALTMAQPALAQGFGGSGVGYGGAYQGDREPFHSRSLHRDWSGPYIGGFVGGAWSDFDKETTLGATGDDSAFVGGLNLGVNAPMRGLIVGGEADISSVDNFVRGAGGYKYTQNWTATFRGRLGFDLEGVLPYVTAGVALTDVEQKVAGVEDSTLQPGIAAGGGIDIMLPQRWFARVEYLYVDVPNDTKTLAGIPVSGGSANSTIRFGLNYKF